jgi:hypothetical protein
MTRLQFSSGFLLIALVPWPASRADEPFRYPEARAGKGELRRVDGISVLLVRGKPEEMGQQIGRLALQPASGLLKRAQEFIKAQGWEKVYPLLLRTGSLMRSRFPPDHLKELEAAASVSGWPMDLLIFANTIPDLRKLGGCSALMIEAERSATGGPLFGRNLDWPPFGPLTECAFVAIHRPEGKLPFASITYPGMIGTLSGTNAGGLTLADLTVTEANDGSTVLDVTGTPYTLALRRVLEECATIAEAEQLLRSLKRTVRQNVAICDRHHAAVFEITPKSLVVRRSVEGICVCTNHFRSEALAVPTTCKRYARLDQCRGMAKLDVAGVARQMDAVNQGSSTLQTMVFEPAALKLHIAVGKGPATRLPLRTLDLGALFSEGPEKAERRH